MHKPLATSRPEHHPSRGHRRQFALVLRPTPDCGDVIKALRWGLKGLLRKHHLRCVSIMEVPTEGPGQSGATPTPLSSSAEASPPLAPSVTGEAHKVRS
jgi:hypothetical protein